MKSPTRETRWGFLLSAALIASSTFCSVPSSGLLCLKQALNMADVTHRVCYTAFLVAECVLTMPRVPVDYYLRLIFDSLRTVSLKCSIYDYQYPSEGQMP